MPTQLPSASAAETSRPAQTQIPTAVVETPRPTQTTTGTTTARTEVQASSSGRIDTFFIYFAPNTDVYEGRGVDTETGKKNVEALKTISKTLKENPNARALIEGEANPVTGTKREAATLAQLSAKRADKIAQFLKSDAGVTNARLIIRSEGGDRTLVPRSDNENWEQNRRVEVRILW